MSSNGLQGHHGIPKGTPPALLNLFRDFLPSWSVDGAYNLTANASTQVASIQLDTLLHSGGHSWYNTAIRNLLDEINLLPDAQKTVSLAAAVNFLEEAQDVSNLGTGSKTGGYVGFLSKRDPLLLDTFGQYPSTAELNAYHADALRLDNILASDAGKEVVALKPKLVDGKLSYEGNLNKPGFFSLTSDELNALDPDKLPDSHKTFKSSTDFSTKFATDNKIAPLPDGAVTIDGKSNGVINIGGKDLNIDYNSAKAFVGQELAGGGRISSFGTLPKVFLKSVSETLKKALSGTTLGVAGIALAVTLAAIPANEAHASEGYDRAEANLPSRNFIAELFGLAVGEVSALLAGAVAGAASFGLLAIPTVITVSEIAGRYGKSIGELFYDRFPVLANEVAENIAPLFGSLADNVVDIATAVFNFAADAFNELSDLVFGVDGLFGLNGPLFGEDGPLQFAANFLGSEDILTNEGEWAYDGFDALLEGTDADDVLVHDGYGEARGGKGDDVLIGFRPEFIAKGDPLFADDENSPLATEEQRLTLDGGEGDDWVITFGGTGAITVGGEGRDFIFNTSAFGQIYGDTLDGLDSDGNPLDHTGTENADTFWYWPGTFIQDAQPNDRITLFGIPLVGGSNSIAGIPAGDGSAALDFFSFGTYYTAGTSGQLAITNLFARYLDIGPEGLEGRQIVENYDFGGFSDESYGRAAPGDLGLTFRIFLPADRALEGVVISLFNAVWGSVFAIIDAAEQLAKLNLFFFIPPQPSRKYCN